MPVFMIRHFKLCSLVEGPCLETLHIGPGLALLVPQPSDELCLREKRERKERENVGRKDTKTVTERKREGVETRVEL